MATGPAFVPRLAAAAVACTAVVLAGPSMSRAQQPPAPTPAAGPGLESEAAKVAPEAQKVLDRLRDSMKSARTVTLTISMSTTMKLEGEEQKHEQALTVAAARPNQIAIRAAEGDEMGQYAIVSDGKTLTQ